MPDPVLVLAVAFAGAAVVAALVLAVAAVRDLAAAPPPPPPPRRAPAPAPVAAAPPIVALGAAARDRWLTLHVAPPPVRLDVESAGALRVELNVAVPHGIEP